MTNKLDLIEAALIDARNSTFGPLSAIEAYEKAIYATRELQADFYQEAVKLGELIRKEALEEAAKVCESYPDWAQWGQMDNYVAANAGAKDCAAAIRAKKALQQQPNKEGGQ